MFPFRSLFRVKAKSGEEFVRPLFIAAVAVIILAAIYASWPYGYQPGAKKNIVRYTQMYPLPAAGTLPNNAVVMPVQVGRLPEGIPLNFPLYNVANVLFAYHITIAEQPGHQGAISYISSRSPKDVLLAYHYWLTANDWPNVMQPTAAYPTGVYAKQGSESFSISTTSTSSAVRVDIAYANTEK